MPTAKRTVTPQAESNDHQLVTRLKGIETRLRKAQEKSPTRERAVAITDIETGRLWLSEHIERNPDSLV